MTNAVAIGLGVLVLGALAADHWLNDGASVVFLGRKLLELIGWVAFWR